MESAYRIECPPNGLKDLYTVTNQLLEIFNPKMVLNTLVNKHFHLNPTFTMQANSDNTEFTSVCTIPGTKITGKGTGICPLLALKSSSLDTIANLFENIPKKLELYNHAVKMLPFSIITQPSPSITEPPKKIEKVTKSKCCSLTEKLISNACPSSRISAFVNAIEYFLRDSKELKALAVSNVEVVGSFVLGCISYNRPIDIISLGEDNEFTLKGHFTPLNKGNSHVLYIISNIKKKDEYIKYKIMWEEKHQVNLYIITDKEAYTRSAAEWDKFDNELIDMPGYISCLHAIRMWRRKERRIIGVHVRKLDRIMSEIYIDSKPVCTNVNAFFGALASKAEELQISASIANDLSKTGLDMIMGS